MAVLVFVRVSMVFKEEQKKNSMILKRSTPKQQGRTNCSLLLQLGGIASCSFACHIAPLLARVFSCGYPLALGFGTRRISHIFLLFRL